MNIPWLRSKFFTQHGVKILMLGLIAEMLISPLADTHPRIGALIGLTVLLMVLSAVGFMANRTIVRRIVLPLAVLWMIARIIEAFGNRNEAYANLSPMAGLALSCSLLWAIFDHFRSDFRNPRGAIAEAFISYLIIATAFAQLYWILNRYVDHAFNQAIPAAQSGTFLYFSMITITSVGYGGILPINPYVRIVAALESMSGIFFVAVVVARLVSSYRPWPGRDHPTTEEDISTGSSFCECGRPVSIGVVSSSSNQCKSSKAAHGTLSSVEPHRMKLPFNSKSP